MSRRPRSVRLRIKSWVDGHPTLLAVYVPVCVTINTVVTVALVVKGK